MVGIAAKAMHALGGLAAGAHFVNNRRRIIELARRRPRRMNKMVRQMGDFRHPLADKMPIGVLVTALLNRVVYAQRVNAGCARLHLRLCVMDTRLIIGEQPRQMQSGWSPMQP